jgi:predicted phage terminase large subunit-like protein
MTVVDLRSESAKIHQKLRLQGSLLEFIKTFYFLRHNRTFDIPEPIGRENHVHVVVRELMKVTMDLMINIPPGHFKSTILQYFIAFSMSHYPDCNFVYISYSNELAEGHTAEVKAIMQLPLYVNLFGVTVDKNSQARGDFRIVTTSDEVSRGRVVARGSLGSITGLNCGLPNAVDRNGHPRFSGLAVMDDLHKPIEVHSELKRQGVITNYNQTIKGRRRGIWVGQILLGQVLHEDDITQFIKRGEDGRKWTIVELQSLDASDNALAPNLISKEELMRERIVNPYMFWSQHQQRPQPAGGGIFQVTWFKLLPKHPPMVASFVTVDCAETEQSYNDATVFSFWGVYKIMLNGTETGEYGIHWIDCRELRIEPKDLEPEFIQFWTDCLRYTYCPPSLAAIEKKSAGTMLCSTLKSIPGIRVLNIERSASSGSKADRFLECQRAVASGQVSLPTDGKHTQMCLEHMRKITANSTHRWDDIADTMADAVKMALIDKIIIKSTAESTDYNSIAASFNSSVRQNINNRRNIFGK